MNYFKSLAWVLVFFSLLGALQAASTFNEDGEFSVFIEDQSATVLNDNIDTFFLFTVTNNEGIQEFEINTQQLEGWDIEVDDNSFFLGPDESKTIRVDLKANSEFDYTPTVFSPDVVKISQKDDYIGYFEFPFSIEGEEENVSMTFSVSIERPVTEPVSFEPRFASGPFSPVAPLQYTITSSHIEEPVTVQIRTYIGAQVISEGTETFTKESNYQIYSHDLPASIDPGNYDAQIVVRYTEGAGAQEWFESSVISVATYENLVTEEKAGANFIKEKHEIMITNEGNVMSVYNKEVPVNFFSQVFFSSNQAYTVADSKATFAIELEQGESITLKYAFNYLALYLIVIAIIILIAYIYVRKSSNPLDVETKVYEIKRVQHEGVKSMKLRIGFENIKADEIETLKLVFKMPTYLQVKDESFLLAPPKNVMKGRDQYKLVWEFKRFGKNDSRILGFTLVNKRGILGDIKLPALELEVKVNGKVRKYYESFPTIR